MNFDGIFHIPTFLSKAEAAHALKALTLQTPWEQKTITLFGKPVLEPRLTAWIGDPDAVYTYSGTRLSPHPWTEALLKMKARIERQCGATFNSVLLNLYRDQNDSMGMHSDDEKELGPQPVIASLSLGAPRRFVMKCRLIKTIPSKTFLLQTGDLLIMRGDCQKRWKHGIPKEKKECGPRINLTFRKILK
jgi:alkylated DNA repair dioxygenase AlkB